MNWNWATTTSESSDTPLILQQLLEGGYLRDDQHPAVIVHNLVQFERRLAYLQNIFPLSTLHTLAIKANPLPGLLCAGVEKGFGLEAASIGELALAESVGCPPERVVFDSPAKTRAELRHAAAVGYTVNANSAAELQRIKQLGLKNFPLGLRINPVVADTSRESSTMVAALNSKFGVTLEQAALLIKEHPEISGLHVHVGSQVATLDDLALAAQRLVGLARAHPQIEWLDIGGGLPVRYRSDDPGLDPQDYYTALQKAAPELGRYRLLTEMGRAIQANCGIAVSRVEYVTQERAILHFGADLAVRECYQSEAWHHEFEAFDSSGLPKRGEPVPYDLYGPLCFSGDRLAKARRLPALQESDLIVMHDIGAYTLGMWSRYCSRPLPEVLGWDGTALSVLRSRETAEQVARWWGSAG